MNQMVFGSHLKTLFLMSAAKSRWIWFLTENCKSKCSLSFYAKQFRLVFSKLIYTFPDEQYCELKHFERFSWNANTFQILNLNLLAEKKIWKKVHHHFLSIFEQRPFGRRSQSFIVRHRGVTGGNGGKVKKIYWFWMSRIFSRVFPKIDFYTSGWVLRNSAWFEVLYIWWYCRILTNYSRLAISKIISTGSDENWRKTKLFEYFRNWFFSNFVQNLWPLI